MEKLCQSCAMPLGGEDTLGTNADGSRNGDYCSYCYQKGAFTSEMTMDQMIDFCAPYMAEHTPGMSAEAAKSQMQAFFPSLKRWAKG